MIELVVVVFTGQIACQENLVMRSDCLVQQALITCNNDIILNINKYYWSQNLKLYSSTWAIYETYYKY